MLESANSDVGVDLSQKIGALNEANMALKERIDLFQMEKVCCVICMLCNVGDISFSPHPPTHQKLFFRCYIDHTMCANEVNGLNSIESTSCQHFTSSQQQECKAVFRLGLGTKMDVNCSDMPVP